MSISRRHFLEAVAGSAAAAGLAGELFGQGAGDGQPAAALGAGAAQPAPGSRPCVVSSRNGLRGVAKAYELMTKEKADPLDAAIAGVNIQELDPNDNSV